MSLYARMGDTHIALYKSRIDEMTIKFTGRDGSLIFDKYLLL